MPIKPENEAKYPATWPDIRVDILRRAGGCCEWCGKPNHAQVLTDQAGAWLHSEGEPYWRVPLAPETPERWRLLPDAEPGALTLFDYRPTGRTKLTLCVLTVAHLDHDPTNNDYRNLRALCQLCHNRWDVPHRAATRRETARQRAESQQNPRGDDHGFQDL